MTLVPMAFLPLPLRWRRRPASVPAQPQRVPDTQALREAALRASWRRDHRVAQRRLALRWTLWALQRYVLPAVAIALLLGWLALQAWPQVERWLERRSHDADGVETRPLGAAAKPSQPEAIGSATPAPDELTPGDLLSSVAGLAPALHLSQALVPAGTPAAPSPPPPSTAAPAGPLKPDHWLHSKEP